MKHVIKRFGEPESAEMKAVRAVLATPGYAQSVVAIDYVDKDGNVTEYGTGTRPIAERHTLDDRGAALHDEIMGGLA